MRGTNSVSQLIECMLVTPFDRYLEQVQKTRSTSPSRNLISSTMARNQPPTPKFEILVNTKDAASRDQLQELVQKETRAENNKLKSKLERLKNINEIFDKRKKRRGHAPSGGASTKRDPKSKPTTKKQKNEKGASTQKADASTKDSNSGTTARKKKGGNKKNKKNSSGPGTGRCK